MRRCPCPCYIFFSRAQSCWVSPCCSFYSASLPRVRLRLPRGDVGIPYFVVDTRPFRPFCSPTCPRSFLPASSQRIVLLSFPLPLFPVNYIFDFMLTVFADVQGPE